MVRKPINSREKKRLEKNCRVDFLIQKKNFLQVVLNFHKERNDF